jgi:RNA-binding protein
MNLTSKQRAYLKSLASNLQPVFQIGKSSLTPENTEAINECFNNNELIKIAVLKNCDDDAKMIAEAVAGRTNSTVVQVIGKKIVLYKPDRDKPKIELPKASRSQQQL